MGSLDVGIFVQASVTQDIGSFSSMPPKGVVGSQAPIANGVSTSDQGSFLVEDGGPSRVLSTLEEIVEPLLKDANRVTKGSTSPTCSMFGGAVGSDKMALQGSLGGGAHTSNVDGGEEPVMVSETMDNNHIVVEQPYGGKESFSLVLLVEEGLESRLQLGIVPGGNLIPLVSLPPLNDIAGTPSD
ncbi:hypothetical protein I3843_07G099800 [Carya illinoinensis]|nr:hypothetical protein I3843_07G099800 [Carya illinoinensis]